VGALVVALCLGLGVVALDVVALGLRVVVGMGVVVKGCCKSETFQ
jgi:hypothetical protein